MDKLTGLVLQGGGALGAYQLGALKALYEKNPTFSPTVVTGVSIGAINAAVLLGGKLGGIKTLEKMWNTLKMPVNPFFPQEWQAKASKIANPSMYHISTQFITMPLTALSVYDLTPFKEFLMDNVDLKKINESPSTLIIESVNVETGELTQFSNRDKDGISFEKILSSMSIPPNFPAMKVDENYYWDGGLYANMPLSPAINVLEKSIGTFREVIVISLFRKKSPLPQNIDEISNRVKEIMFESKIELDRAFFNKINDLVELFEEIDASLPADSPLRRKAAYKRMLNHQKINQSILLQYEAEGVEGTDDFTPEAMDSRIRTGYRDMLQAIENPKKSAL